MPRVDPTLRERLEQADLWTEFWRYRRDLTAAAKEKGEPTKLCHQQALEVFLPRLAGIENGNPKGIDALKKPMKEKVQEQSFQKLREAARGRHFDEKACFQWVLLNLQGNAVDIDPESVPCVEAVNILQEVRTDAEVRAKFMDTVHKRLIKVCEVGDSAKEDISDDGRSVSGILEEFISQHSNAVSALAAERSDRSGQETAGNPVGM